MATATTVQDIYNAVTYVLNEDFADGAGPGLSLGIVTLSDFLTLFSAVLEEFVNKTGLVYSIFTQTLNFNLSMYLAPPDINTIKECFVGGQWINHTTLFDLDDWQYNWRSKLDTPEYWHEDGLPPKTVELAANPNYNGASYLASSDPTLQPPFGLYGLFNGATQGLFTSAVSTTGTAVTWLSGALFDLNWNNYYPPSNISIAGASYPIQSVTSATTLVLAASAGVQATAASSVIIGNDGNLTMIGTTGLSSITYTLGTIIPVVPDSLCWGIGYGILARIFSNDGESKDMQRAAYCLARYVECANVAAAIAGQMLEQN